jgi:hypothetical protein
VVGAWRARGRSEWALCCARDMRASRGTRGDTPGSALAESSINQESGTRSQLGSPHPLSITLVHARVGGRPRRRHTFSRFSPEIRTSGMRLPLGLHAGGVLVLASLLAPTGAQSPPPPFPPGAALCNDLCIVQTGYPSAGTSEPSFANNGGCNDGVPSTTGNPAAYPICVPGASHTRSAL